MNKESVAEFIEPQETGPASFPIITDEETYYFDRTPDLKEGQIIHYKQGVFSGEKRHRFLLLKSIAGLNFEFSLNETSYGDDVYQLSFKTKEYEYATTNLDPDTNNSLFSIIASFVKSVSESPEYNIKEIRISPAHASYSVEEINQCIDKIITSPKNKFSREELMSDYNGFRIFEFYKELFGEDFLEKHYNGRNRASGRSRFFKMMIRKHFKHFPDWEIDTEFSRPGSDFNLKRKGDKP